LLSSLYSSRRLDLSAVCSAYCAAPSPTTVNGPQNAGYALTGSVGEARQRLRSWLVPGNGIAPFFPVGRHLETLPDVHCELQRASDVVGATAPGKLVANLIYDRFFIPAVSRMAWARATARVRRVR
jgi:hypothetical protein